MRPSPRTGIIYPYIIWYAVMLHISWAALTLSRASAIHATPLAEITRLFPATWPLVAALLASSGVAVWGLTRPYHNVAVFVMLLPQLFILTIGAFGCLLAVKNGYYADGVVRPREFIAADQAPAVIATLLYAVAITKLWPR